MFFFFNQLTVNLGSELLAGDGSDDSARIFRLLSQLFTHHLRLSTLIILSVLKEVEDDEEEEEDEEPSVNGHGMLTGEPRVSCIVWLGPQTASKNQKNFQLKQYRMFRSKFGSFPLLSELAAPRAITIFRVL